MIAASTLSWIEIVWLVCTGTALIVSAFVLNNSLVNLIVLRYSSHNSVLRYMTITEIIKNALRVTVQMIFVAIGIWSAFLPNAPVVSTMQIIFSGSFLVAAGLLALASIFDLIRFRHVLTEATANEGNS